jgi:hypothetical protein
LGVHHKSNFFFFFATSQFDWPIAKKKVETMKAPQSRRFYGNMKCFSFWPTYIGKKGRTLGKTYGIKARCYWEHPWGTHWHPIKHIGNLMGTCWEQRKNEKNPPPPQFPLKEKKSRALWVHPEPSHWLHEISISKTVRHHFWPGLIPPL